MNDIVNKKAIIQVLGLDDAYDLKRFHELDKFDWDSMTMVMLQTYIDTEFNIQIDPDHIPDLKTIGCIDDFIETLK